jgi:hypothetical protein
MHARITAARRIAAEVTAMSDPRYAPTTNDDPAQDPAEGPRDPAYTEDAPASGSDPRTETDTHTAALQGAAAGGAMSGNAGYAGGLMTGSENDIGMRDIPEKADEEPAGG